ncbi:MAG: phosphatidylglycerophosphatase A [Alphaproteobacteria bacterium]|nr:phosphatidylglycerophosphatase A [Alphaproteobacteria bacterium]
MAKKTKKKKAAKKATPSKKSAAKKVVVSKAPVVSNKAPAAPKKKNNFSLSVGSWHIATLGPLGYFPKGPGTIGSLVALPVVYLLSYLSAPFLWFTIFILFLLGLLAVQQFTQDKTEKDPSCVIIDEVVGQMIPFVVVLPELMHGPMLLVGFLLFRFFDIFKFGAVAFWDRKKTPMGVMMDDVTAGIFAGFIMAMIQIVIVEFWGM